MKAIKKELRIVKKTLSGLNKEFFLVMGFEALYFFIVYLLRDPVKVLDVVAAKEIATTEFDVATLLTNPALLEANIGLLQSFIGKMVLVLVGFFVLHSALYSAFNYLSWHRIADKHFDMSHAKGFVKISAIWVFMWMILFASALLVFDHNYWGYVFLGFIVMFLHMTTMMNIVLIHNKKHCDIKSIFGKTFRMSFRKLPHCWAPYSSGAAIVIGLGVLLIYLVNSIHGLDSIKGELLLFYFIAFITWWRTHLYHSLKRHTTRV